MSIRGTMVARVIVRGVGPVFGAGVDNVIMNVGGGVSVVGLVCVSGCVCDIASTSASPCT